LITFGMDLISVSLKREANMFNKDEENKNKIEQLEEKVETLENKIANIMDVLEMQDEVEDEDIEHSEDEDDN